MSHHQFVIKTDPLPPARSVKHAVRLAGPTVQSTATSGDQVNRVVEIPGSERVATASGDKVVRVYNAQTGGPLRELRGHTKPVSGLASLGGSLIASGQEGPGDDACPSFFVWSLDCDEPLSSLQVEAWVWAIVALGDGKLVMCPGGDIVILRHKNGRALNEERRRPKAHERLVSDAAVCGGRIATASWDTTVGVWDAETLAPLAKLQGHSSSVLGVVLTQRLIVSVSSDKTLRLYDAQRFCCNHSVEGAHTGEVRSVALVNDQHCISFSADETACVVNIDSGVVVARVQTGVMARHGAVLHGGRVVVAGDVDRVVIHDPPRDAVHLFQSNVAATTGTGARSLHSGSANAEMKSQPKTDTGCFGRWLFRRRSKTNREAKGLTEDEETQAVPVDVTRIETKKESAADRTAGEDVPQSAPPLAAVATKAAESVESKRKPESSHAPNGRVAEKAREDKVTEESQACAAKEEGLDTTVPDDSLAADVAKKREEEKQLELGRKELQIGKSQEALLQKTVGESQSRARAKEVAECPPRRTAIEIVVSRKRESPLVESTLDEKRQEPLASSDSSFSEPAGNTEAVCENGQEAARNSLHDDQRSEMQSSANANANTDENAECTAEADFREGNTNDTSAPGSTSARMDLRDLELTRRKSGNNVVLFDMAGALASAPLDGGAAAVMCGVSLLLRAVYLVKDNLKLMDHVPLAMKGLEVRVSGLERCLKYLLEAPKASPFLSSYIHATGQILDESCKVMDDVITDFKNIDRGGRVVRKVRVLLGRGQKRCADRLGMLADQIQSAREDLHFCISVDSNTSSRITFQEDASHDHSIMHSPVRSSGNLQTSANYSTFRGMQAIAAAACGAFGDVRMLLLALKRLIDQVPVTTVGYVLQKLEELSLTDFLPCSTSVITTEDSAGESGEISDDEVLTLREELRGPVDDLMSAVRNAGDEVLSGDERSLALEMLGCLWRPWRSVSRKDLNRGRLLGSGAYGLVYAGKWTPGGSKSPPIPVAMKCIDVSGDESKRRRKVESIEMEAGVMRDCKHACIVRIYGIVLPATRKLGIGAVQPENFKHGNADIPVSARAAGPSSPRSPQMLSFSGELEEADEAVIVMEKMGGSALRAMQNQALQSFEDKILVLRDTADGMAYLHMRGVAHLDLKPENILLNIELRKVGEEDQYVVFGRAKVCDFGCMRRAKSDTKQWAMSQGVGTLEYMAPEMLKEARPTATVSCDLFSYGVLICAMLGSEEALDKFRQLSIQERMEMAAVGRLSKLLGQCIGSVDDDRVREVCQACVEERPGDRPSFERVLLAMNAIVQNLPIGKVRDCLYKVNMGSGDLEFLGKVPSKH